MEKNQPQNNLNTGFIEEFRPTDFVFGGITGITHEDRNTTGDWGPFLPSVERQSGRFFDTMGCVSFSCLNSLEAQLRWMLENKLLSKAAVAFLNGENLLKISFLDKDGLPNLSDRFLVVMSNTGPTGNSMQAVWDAVRKFGFVPEAAWPNNLDSYNRQKYFATVSDDVKKLGLESKQHFRSEYEFIGVRSQLPRALQHAPIQLASAVCPGWSNPGMTVKTCGLAASHATLIYDVKPDNTLLDFDHYEPFNKVLAADYELPYLVKGVLSPLTSVVPPPPPPQDNGFYFDRDLSQGETSIDVSFLQRRLAVITPPTGFYGPMTVAKVLRYMQDRNIGSWWEKNVWPAGRRVGPKIRADLNSNR